MTTIIYDPKQGEIASDSQDTEDGTKINCKKLFRVNGYIIATAGGSYSGLMFVQWFRGWKAEPDYTNREKAPDLTNLSEDEDFECLVIRPDGRCYTVNRLFVPYSMPKGQPVSLGSGGGIALGAVFAGADVREAVKIAARIDNYTGGRVQTMKVKP